MAASTPPPDPTDNESEEDDLTILRYSLPAMLAELRRERTTGSFAMEKLEQAEIGKLFTPKTRKRRVKSNS